MCNVKNEKGDISAVRIATITIMGGMFVVGVAFVVLANIAPALIGALFSAALVPFALPVAIGVAGLGVAMFIGKGAIETSLANTTQKLAGAATRVDWLGWRVNQLELTVEAADEEIGDQEKFRELLSLYGCLAEEIAEFNGAHSNNHVPASGALMRECNEWLGSQRSMAARFGFLREKFSTLLRNCATFNGEQEPENRLSFSANLIDALLRDESPADFRELLTNLRHSGEIEGPAAVADSA
jgi:hypothetical protein